MTWGEFKAKGDEKISDKDELYLIYINGEIDASNLSITTRAEDGKARIIEGIK